MKKIIMIFISASFIMSLCGCGFIDEAVDDMKKDREWAIENNAFTDGNGSGKKSSDENDSSSDNQIVDQPQKSDDSDELKVGETTTFTVDQGDKEGEIELTILNWGSIWSDNYEQNIIWFDTEFNNVGENPVSISAALFAVYADDYSVDLSYLESDGLQTTSLDSGRKAKGRVYAVVDSNSVNSIEVQVSSAVWVLQRIDTSEPNSVETDSTTENEVATEETSTSYGDFSGEYTGSKYTATVTMYAETMTSSDDELVCGTIDIFCNGEKLFSKDLYLEDEDTAPWNKQYDVLCSFAGFDVGKNYAGFTQSAGKNSLDLGFDGEYSDTLEINN